MNSIVEFIQSQMTIQMDENTIYNVSLIIGEVYRVHKIDDCVEPREGESKEEKRMKSKTVSA